MSAAAWQAAGSVLSGLGSLGSVFGGSDGDSANDQVRAQLGYQKKIRRHGYKWAVEGAQKAGLHPLFALGTSGSFSPMSFMPGQSRSGSHAGDALSALGDVATNIGNIYSRNEQRKLATHKMIQADQLFDKELERMRLENLKLANDISLQAKTPLNLNAVGQSNADMESSAQQAHRVLKEQVAAATAEKNYPDVIKVDGEDFFLGDPNLKHKLENPYGEEASIIELLWQYIKDKHYNETVRPISSQAIEARKYLEKNLTPKQTTKRRSNWLFQ